MPNKVSVIIPVFNEGQTITDVIERVLRADVGGAEKEVVVVDDGSEDKTADALKTFTDQIIYLGHPTNCGQGFAFQTGLKQATGDVVIFHDADLEYDPADWRPLLELLNEPGVSVVYGCRKDILKTGHFFAGMGAKIITATINLLFGSRLQDAYSGMKLFRASVIKSLPLQSSGFEIAAEITVKILKKGITIREMPVRYHPRTAAEGKKIKWQDWFRGMYEVLRNRIEK